MDKEAWLKQVIETVREPDLPICDPHHHLWDYPGQRYMLDEMLDDVGSGHNICSTVFVECGSMYSADVLGPMNTVGETEFVQGIAAMSASGQYGNSRIAAGIVAHVDLCLGADVETILRAHIAASPNRFRGVRHASGWHSSNALKNSHSNPPPSLMLDDAFRQGLAVLGALDLTFDAWCYHGQLPEFVRLARALPDVTLILDHFGGPLGVGPYAHKKDAVFATWQENIAPLRECHNVFFKLGGINMKANGFNWHKRPLPPTSDELVDKTGRYYEYCIQQFGSERCMFESNFPVDKESCSYQVLWNTFKKLSQSMTAQDRANLFHDTAVKVYKLAAHEA